jgi:hypothetical protein
MKKKKRLADRWRERTKDNYPFPLMSKGEREKKGMEIENICMKIGGNGHRGSDGHKGSMRKSISITMPLVLPSMPKGEIVEILVFIDVNP